MSDHYYDSQGNPCYEVPCKSRPGEMRPATLADAKKHYGWVPSVTTVLGILDKSGLVEYKVRQVLESALTLPAKEGEDLTAYSKRVRYDAEEHARQAANKGVWVHNAIEEWFTSTVMHDTSYKFVAAACSAMEQLGLSTAPDAWTAEKTFCSPLGFGGKVDLHNSEAVVDFKTKGNWTDPKKLGYDEHAMQIAAYDAGLVGASSPYTNNKLYLPPLPGRVPQPFQFRRHINIFISTEEPGKVEAVEWKEPEFYWKMFSHCLELWKMAKRFNC